MQINLMGLIRRYGQNRVASAVGISTTEMSRRLSGDGRFTLDEIERLIGALGLACTEGQVVMPEEEYRALLTVQATLLGRAIARQGHQSHVLARGVS